MYYVYRKLVVFFVSVLLLSSCEKREIVSLSGFVPVNVPAALDSIIEIKNWLGLGPFEFDTVKIHPSMSFFIDDLKQYGVTEGTIDEVTIRKLQKKGVRGFIARQESSRIRMITHVDDGLENKSHFYLVTKIISARPQKVTFMIDGSNSYATWLNGEKLIEVRGKHSNTKIGDRFVNVSLIKGENMLFVKINRGANLNSWHFIFNISSCQTAKRIFCTNYAGDFVVNPVVTDSFEVYAGPFLSGKVEVMDLKDQIVSFHSFENQNTNDKPFPVYGLHGLKEGFYKTRLTVGDERIEEMIYKGDYDKFVAQAKVSVENSTGSNAFMEDLKATMFFVDDCNTNITAEDLESPSTMRRKNRNKVFWGYSLYSMLEQEMPSTRIMTYQEETGNVSEFIFHANEKLQQNIPLVIILPISLQGTLFLKEWYVSNLDQIEPDNMLADQYGFALALIYAKGKNYTAQKTEEEITSVIDRLGSEYDIDKHNIFLLGTCDGGRKALVQLSRTPEKYAACALKAPITLTDGIDGIAVDLIPLMGKTPVIIEHGTHDDHISVEHSRIFVAKAKEQGLPVVYIEPNIGTVYANNDHNLFAFEFFRKIVMIK